MMMRPYLFDLMRARAATACRFAFIAVVVACCGTTSAQAPPRAGIASAHPLATEAGYRMLREGGNAFDAAVAVAAALAVVEPYSTGLGGGGFWLLHHAADGRQVMIDARETAPAAATLSAYLDGSGKPLAGVMRGGKAIGIPGVPAGLVHLARHYGRLPLAQSLAPAIALARDGFKVDLRYVRLAQLRERFLADGVNTAATYLVDRHAPQPGHLLRQPQLAATLELIAQQGRDGFYRGRVADALMATVNAAGGAWQASDLEGYRIIERLPVIFTYRGATIVSASLPSSGGLTLAETLNILERFPLGDARDPATAHLVIEALRRGFQDRALYLGDSDFVAVPIAKLMDKAYARDRAATIDPAVATPSDWLTASPTMVSEAYNTTHYSVIDAAGNRVGATLSINSWFGSGVIAADTGILLNNELDDFSLQPEVANAYRLRSGAANRIAPHKRPLSSMTPTFVEDSRGALVLGAPGGSRIISMVLLGILDYVGHSEVDLRRMVSAPRYHHQCWPDRIEIEPESFPAEWRAALEARKHTVQPGARKWGNMQVVYKSNADGSVQAASDPRGLEDFAGY